MRNWFIKVSLLIGLVFATITGTGLVQAQQRISIIEDIIVVGNQRIEPETVLSYIKIQKGDVYREEDIDASLKTLFNTGLFADVKIGRSGGNVVIQVTENPI